MVMRAMGAWMRKKKKRETMTVTCKKWSQTGEKGIESWEVGLGVCVWSSGHRLGVRNPMLLKMLPTMTPAEL